MWYNWYRNKLLIVRVSDLELGPVVVGYKPFTTCFLVAACIQDRSAGKDRNGSRNDLFVREPSAIVVGPFTTWKVMGAIQNHIKTIQSYKTISKLYSHVQVGCSPSSNHLYLYLLSLFPAPAQYLLYLPLRNGAAFCIWFPSSDPRKKNIPNKMLPRKKCSMWMWRLLS